jgi:hypothetical protein
MTEWKQCSTQAKPWRVVRLTIQPLYPSVLGDRSYREAVTNIRHCSCQETRSRHPELRRPIIIIIIIIIIIHDKEFWSQII